MNIFFYHIPRTGGLTVCKWIESYSSWEYEWLDRNRDDLSEINIPSEKNILVGGHYEWGAHKKLDVNCRCITVLRHPLEKLMSSYYKSKDTHRIGDNESFRDYIESDRNIHNLQVKQIAGEGYYTDRKSCMEDLYYRAKINLRNCIWSATTNNLDQDLRGLSNILSLDYHKPKRFHDRDRPRSDSIKRVVFDKVEKNNSLDCDLWSLVVRDYV